MFRLIGFVFGSAISIGAILLILGIPQFHLSNPHLDKGRFEEAVEKLKEKTRDVEVIAQDVAQAVGDKLEEIPLTEGAAAPPASPATVTPAEAVADAIDEVPLEAPPAYELPVDAVPAMLETQWHPFWNPFRSKIAANGFVSQLEKVTGLDYRVVKVKAGVYQVAFAYGNDEERRTKLTQISAATGLDLPES